MGAAALKRALTAMRAEPARVAACVEKSELLALALSVASMRRRGDASATPAVATPVHVAASGAANEYGAGTTRASALVVGLPNAFEVHGLSGSAPAAATSTAQAKAYEQLAAAGPSADLTSFWRDARSIATTHAAVQVVPPAKLSVRVPAAVLNPVLREVSVEHWKACSSEAQVLTSTVQVSTTGPISQPPAAAAQTPAIASSASSSTATASSTAGGAASEPLTHAALLARALPALLSRQSLGPRRYFELALRADSSTMSVLAALREAGADAGLAVTHASERSLILQQRVCVPATALAAFAASAAVTAPAVRGASPTHIIDGNGNSGGSAAAAASGGGGVSSWMRGALGLAPRLETYVNAVVACVGVNGALERVLLIAAVRFMPTNTEAGVVVAATAAASAPTTAMAGSAGAPPAIAAAASTMALPHPLGPLRNKDRPGGTIAAAGTAAASAGTAGAAAAASLLADLGSTGGGITCSLTTVRPAAPPPSYRAVGTSSSAHAAVSSAPRVAADDIFGAPFSEASSGVSAAPRRAPRSAEDAIMQVPPLPPALAALAGSASAATSSHGSEALAGSLSALGCDAAAAEDEAVAAGCSSSGDDFDDGSCPVPAQLPPWSHLRVSFLEPQMAASPGASSGGSAAAVPTNAASAAPFSVAALADELVGVTCELAAALRSRRVLAESVWVDAISVSKHAIAVLRDQAPADGTQAVPPLSFPTSVAALLAPPVIAAAKAPASKLPAPSAGLAPLAGTGNLDAIFSSASRTVKVEDIFDALEQPPSSLAPAPESAATPAASSPPAPAAAPAHAPTPPTAAPPSLASASAPLTSSSPVFHLHGDVLRAVTAHLSGRSDAVLARVSAPYEARARRDEWLGAQVLGALTGAYAAAGLTPPAAPALPRVDDMPAPADEDAVGSGSGSTEVLTLTLAALRRAASEAQPAGTDAALRGAIGASPGAPAGLTAADETLREIYVRAYQVCRALAAANAAATALVAHSVDVSARRRLARKAAHVSIRVAASFWRAAAALSQLQDVAAARGPVASSASAVAGNAAAAASDAGRALVGGVFGLAGTAALLHTPASAANVLGELALTADRALFHASTLGFRTRRIIPYEALICVTPTPTLLGVDATLTLTFIDDEKRAKAAAKSAKAAASVVSAHAPAPTPIQAPTPPIAPLAAPTTGHASLSVKDAFDAMCEIGGDPAPTMPSTSVSAPTATAALAAAAKVSAPPATPSLPPMLRALGSALTADEALLFFSAGGANPDLLTQLHVTPLGCSREAMYVVLQTLRQLEQRPHLREFAFPLLAELLQPAATTSAADAAAQLPPPTQQLRLLSVPAELPAPLRAGGEGTPLLLRADKAAALAAARAAGAPAAPASALDDLFAPAAATSGTLAAVAPASASTASPEKSHIYGDL